VSAAAARVAIGSSCETPRRVRSPEPGAPVRRWFLPIRRARQSIRGSAAVGCRSKANAARVYADGDTREVYGEEWGVAAWGQELIMLWTYAIGLSVFYSTVVQGGPLWVVGGSGSPTSLFQFDENTGEFISSTNEGDANALGVAIGPDKNVYVTSNTNGPNRVRDVLKYNGSTPAFLAALPLIQPCPMMCCSA